MNGPAHYREAERLIERASNTNRSAAVNLLAEAQVHATLALTAATAYPAVKDWLGEENRAAREWTAET